MTELETERRLSTVETHCSLIPEIRKDVAEMRTWMDEQRGAQRAQKAWWGLIIVSVSALVGWAAQWLPKPH